MDKIELALKVLEITSRFDGFDDVMWSTTGEFAPVTFYVNCNDLFDWAVSDAVDVTPDNVSILEKSYEDAEETVEHGFTEGAILFCCRVRGRRPQGRYYGCIPEELWPLFDACGPEREVCGNATRPKLSQIDMDDEIKEELIKKQKSLYF